MAELADLERALVNADAAGDADAARALAAEISRLRGAASSDPRIAEARAKEEAFRASVNPTDTMGRTRKFLAGTGKAFTDIARGGGQLVGLVDREDVDESKRRDAALMRTGPGIAGNIVGNIAATAPLALVPGANTIAGGAITGAAAAALQPVDTDDSRLRNMAFGGAFGAAVPAAIQSGRVAKAALVDPFTEAGRNRIAAQVLRRAAADPDAVIPRLQAATGATPGFTPTVGQAADDAGLASLERTMRAIDPRGFDQADKLQRGALVDALRRIAQTPEARRRAVGEADAAVRPLYDAAKKTAVEGDEVIEALLARPSMRAAAGRAGDIAAERGESFAISAATPEASAQPTLSDFLSSTSMTRSVPAAPSRLRGDALHDLKMGLDDAIGSPGLGGMQGAERNAALGTKEEFLSWLEQKIPEYGKARATYADKMRPANQMDIGQELYNRFVPALSDQGGLPFRSTAQTFANALRNGDDLARNVTGLNSVKLDDIMTPEQLRALQGVAKDSATKAAAENIGRGVGSDTVQKISMSNVAAQAGIPNWLSAAGAVPGGWVKRAGDLLYGSADEQVRMRMAELLRNPQDAAQVMKAVGVPQREIARYLRAASQSAATALPLSVESTE